ncbi:unnamed protein product [Sympodiomycopsis kandeliae]
MDSATSDTHEISTSAASASSGLHHRSSSISSGASSSPTPTCTSTRTLTSSSSHRRSTHCLCCQSQTCQNTAHLQHHDHSHHSPELQGLEAQSHHTHQPLRPSQPGNPPSHEHDLPHQGTSSSSIRCAAPHASAPDPDVKGSASSAAEMFHGEPFGVDAPSHPRTATCGTDSPTAAIGPNAPSDTASNLPTNITKAGTADRANVAHPSNDEHGFSLVPFPRESASDSSSIVNKDLIRGESGNDQIARAECKHEIESQMASSSRYYNSTFSTAHSSDLDSSSHEKSEPFTSRTLQRTDPHPRISYAKGSSKCSDHYDSPHADTSSHKKSTCAEDALEQGSTIPNSDGTAVLEDVSSGKDKSPSSVEIVGSGRKAICSLRMKALTSVPSTLPCDRSSQLPSGRQVEPRGWSRTRSTGQRSHHKINWAKVWTERNLIANRTTRDSQAMIWREEDRRRRVGSSNLHASESTHGSSLDTASFHNHERLLRPVSRPKRRRLHENVDYRPFESDIERSATESKATPNARDSEADTAVNLAVEESRPPELAQQTAVASSEGSAATAACALESADCRVEWAEPSSSGSTSAPERRPPNNDSLPSLSENTSYGKAVQVITPCATTQAGPSRHRRCPLRRSQSLPNLRARQDLDPSAPARHRLITPHHLTRHASSARQTIVPGKQQGSAAAYNARQRQSRAAGSATRSYVVTPPMMPPITRTTLRELDLHEIVKNPQLRHDIVFDAHVQFRPNFDGDRGRRKREACERYWTAVSREIELGCVCTSFDGNKLLPCSCARQSDKKSERASWRQTYASPMPSRLPNLVLELRAICLSILPNPSSSPASHFASGSISAGGTTATHSPPSTPTSRAVKVPTTFFSGPATTSSSHYSLLAAGLDPTLISQQLQHGVLNVAELVQFVASILKLHCAPVRDELIDQMVDLAQRGEIGQSLRMCFEILEVMKLDIANHQLRSTRPWLINTAVEFEARWFKDQVVAGRMGSLEKTTLWYRQSWKDVTDAGQAGTLTRKALVVKAFNEGFMRLVFESRSIETDQSLCSGSIETSTAQSRQVSASTSSSSLNNAYSTTYPETFQFDAYRLTTFQNEAVDLSIMYMLLLLFRQLACSPSIAASDNPAGSRAPIIARKAAGLTQHHIEAIKAEICTLLAEASVTTSRDATGARGNSAAASYTAMNKFKDEQWIQGIRSVLLQIAARAGAVWDEASKASCSAKSTPSCVGDSVRLAEVEETLPTIHRTPNAKTMAMLESWLTNQLRPESALMKMCTLKLKNVLGRLVGDRTASHAKVASTTLEVDFVIDSANRTRGVQDSKDKTDAQSLVSSRKRAEPDAPEETPLSVSPRIAKETTRFKRRKAEEAQCYSTVDSDDDDDDNDDDDDGDDDLLMDVSSKASPISSCASLAELSHRIIRPCGAPRPAKNAPASSQVATEDAGSNLTDSVKCADMPAASTGPEDWDAMVSKAGLDNLKNEIRSLGGRLAQVAIMNIKTFRCLYEAIVFPDAA